jgi:hypothetical protein
VSKEIWKLPLKLWEPTKIVAPFTPRGIVHVGEQYGDIHIWVEVCPLGYEPEEIEVSVFGTGWVIPSGDEYVGTVQVDDFVWHVYRKGGAK